MTRVLSSAFVFLLTALAATGQTADQKRVMMLLEQASTRLMQGDITALDDVKALPGDDSVAGLLMFFKQHYYVFSKETARKAIALKAAQYVTECPTSEAYIKRLFRKEEGRASSRLLNDYRQTVLDCLTAAKNAFAVRVLIELMNEPTLEIPMGGLGIALAKMDLPGAPFGKNTERGPSSPEGIAKWKEWWSANKGTLAD